VKKVGKYTLTYSLTDPSGNTTETKRVVYVIDTIAPHIALNGNKSDTLEVNSTYSDLGVTTSDNYDNTVTTTVRGTFYSNFPSGKATKLGAYNITYIATDSSGNKDSITRLIDVVDREKPVISLLGDSLAKVCRWADYRDSGYTVSDNYYTTVKVDTEGTFTTSGGTQLPGIYSLRYKATDGSGNVGYSRYRILVVLSDTSSLCKSGIAEGLLLERYIHLYPNPTSGTLTITANLPSQERVVMTITNALGQTITTVSNGNLSQNTFTVDLSGKASGIYMLNIISTGEKITKRILLTK
jgi:hypothetical protein